MIAPPLNSSFDNDETLPFHFCSNLQQTHTYSAGAEAAERGIANGMKKTFSGL